MFGFFPISSILTGGNIPLIMIGRKYPNKVFAVTLTSTAIRAPKSSG